MMDVTEISSRFKVSKIMVYRYINTHEIKPVTKKGRTNFYDNKAFHTISKGLSREIETKNEQIRELSSINKELTVAFHQQQQLLLYEQQKTTQLLEQTQKEPESKWWQFWK